jgi:hypothetical protein
MKALAGKPKRVGGPATFEVEDDSFDNPLGVGTNSTYSTDYEVRKENLNYPVITSAQCCINALVQTAAPASGTSEEDEQLAARAKIKKLDLKSVISQVAELVCCTIQLAPSPLIAVSNL